MGESYNVPINKELNAELRSKYGTWAEVQREYNQITGENRSMQTLAKNHSRYQRKLRGVTTNKVDEPVHESERYIEVSTNEMLTEAELLELHGYDSDTWQITSSGSSRAKADRASKDGAQLYSIRTSNRINAKPVPYKLTETNVESLLAKSNIEPIEIKCETINNTKLMIHIPLFDMHFGNNAYEDYMVHQQQIAQRLSRDDWENVVFFIGQDLFHNDDFKGHTSNQTRIEKVDMEQAWEDAHKFYQPLIEIALKFSDKVKVIFSRGNHDETVGFYFVKSLQLVFPQVEFDTRQEEYKGFLQHGVFYGATHGDKINDNKIVRVFEAEFRLQMAQATRRVIYRGHLHTLKSFDDNGTHVFALGTANKSDQWHRENGYIGNHKAFEIFVYDDETMLEHLFIEN